MIRPCDNCGGTGCPRCAEMPLLSLVYFELLDIEALSQRRAKFRPDPAIVMRWCQTHQSRMDGDLCLESLYEDKWDSTGWEPCKAVWVEKPTPLEEADDE